MFVLLSGSANFRLAEAVSRELGVPLGDRKLARFPDGELEIAVEAPVRGRSAYILQPTSPPGAENLLELLLLADACRRSGARQVTAVIPYAAEMSTA